MKYVNSAKYKILLLLISVPHLCIWTLLLPQWSSSAGNPLSKCHTGSCGAGAPWRISISPGSAEKTGSNRLRACTVQTLNLDAPKKTMGMFYLLSWGSHHGLRHQCRNDLSELGQAACLGTAQLQLSWTSAVLHGHLLMARHHFSREAGGSFTTTFLYTHHLVILLLYLRTNRTFDI